MNTSEGGTAHSQLTSETAHQYRWEKVLTVEVGHHEHLRLWQAFPEVVEMDGAVERDEADPRPGVSGKPERNTLMSELEG